MRRGHTKSCKNQTDRQKTKLIGSFASQLNSLIKLIIFKKFIKNSKNLELLFSILYTAILPNLKGNSKLVIIRNCNNLYVLLFKA